GAGARGVASFWFVHMVDGYLEEAVRPFVLKVVLPPLVAAFLAGVAGWWVAGSGSLDLDSWTHAHALARLALGATAVLAVITAGYLATRALTPGNVRELLALLPERPAPPHAAPRPPP